MIYSPSRQSHELLGWWVKGTGSLVHCYKILFLNLQGSNFINQLKVPLDSVMYDNRGKSEIFLEILLKDSDEHIVAQNYFYPVPIKDIVGIRNPQLSVSSAVPY